MEKKGSLYIHTENIFPIIKQWLYSEHDIFARELISNAVDAQNKRLAIDPEIDRDTLNIEVVIDKEASRIDFIDRGIGMTAEEIDKYINQIAFSGAEDFIEKFKDKQSSIIGHFGLGFYSSFMVADRVIIDSLSARDGAEAARWECDGSTEFTIEKGERTEVGTTISVFVNKEHEQYLEDFTLREILERYCNFMPFPIELNKKVVNQTSALWLRKPKDIKDEEYKEFYKKLFHDFEDPLFWIHLNVDFPFNLKGILYFPRIKNDLDFHRGTVKLYCNNVFVADNLKEFIPEFLLMLRGGIDIPDIPLNVSRSFLQQDKQLKKMTGYIIKKVADRFVEMFNEDREQFTKLWEDIQAFVKFGIITNNDFFEAIKDIILFKSSNGDWVTLEEYKARNKAEEREEGKEVHKIYYAASENTQVSYLKLMKEQNLEVIYSTTPIDTHVFQHLETHLPFTNFVRVDSELNETLIDTDKAEIVDADNKTEGEKVKSVFENALDDKNVQIDPKRLKSKEIPAMVIFNEHMRRFHDMQNLMNRDGELNLLSGHTLMVNLENPTVKKILSLHSLGRQDDAALLCRYVHKLALLEQKQFTGTELSRFIETTNKVLEMIK